jgi:hypothetical protein
MNLKLISALVVAILLCTQAAQAQSKDDAATIHVDITSGHEINSFDPDVAMGSSIDALSHSSIDKVYTPHIIQESLSAGWGPISYRNNTELRMAAWHWTENGTWSDATGKRGYFTGSPELKDPIRYILPYALPHRGFSTSGDRPITGPNLTYWKSNPYLTSKFTGESDALHPQWVVIDLKSQKSVNAIRIAWASPSATNYRVEYWIGKDPLEFDKGPEGEWKAFDSGSQKSAAGGTVTLKLSNAPVTAQYFRIWMTESSNTCDEHGSGDIRNCVGYAIKEIDLGSLDANNEFKGAAQDAAEQQKFTYCSSSIDPWHSADDVNSSGNGQHSGFDLFYTSGITL